MDSLLEVNQQISAEEVNAMLDASDLLYNEPPLLGLATQCHYVSNFPQQQTYSPGSTIIMDFQTGTQFVDFKNSYMHFNLSVSPANATCDFGQGSAMNLINRISIKGRDGKEICHLDSANLWQSISSRYNAPLDYFKTIAPAYGYPSLAAQGGYEAASPSTTLSGGDGASTFLSTAAPANGVVGSQIVIPLCWFPCFNEKYGKLYPPQLAAGLHMELILENLNTALFSATGGTAPTTYSMTQVEFKLKSYVLSDAFSRRIGEISATQGLVLCHDEVFRNIVNTSATNSGLNTQIGLAASNVTKLYVVQRQSNDVNNLPTDSMVACAGNLISTQSYLGATYYPVSPLVTTLQSGTANNTAYTPQLANELYAYTIAAAGSNDYRRSCYVNPSQYCTGVSVISAPAGGTGAFGSWAVYMENFDKSTNDMGVSGVYTNNSRSLNITQVYANTALAHRYELFVVHQRLLKVFVSNVAVDD